ncbi:Ceruloplasmin [Oryzias melastigma]|uniref:ferroxidase n=1 Tax=Oryzias melastigma TaxID=30732 RepID=A0A834BSN2_ORYME|nr:Ceruloplasmin [Oryzias melastigma]
MHRDAAVFLKKGPQRIGSTYKKAVYKQYSDATYRTEVVKPNWLGYLGPVLMAEEGDTVIVNLKNSASRPYSIHPHGLNYSKGSEGALYPDGTSHLLKQDDSVPPGRTVTYEWTLPESHSPTADDNNCMTRFYHSHVCTIKDINSGLIGPLLICKRGTLDVHGDRSADYTYSLLFMVADENFSWYLDENIRTHITNPVGDLKDDEDFIESNKMHGINGFLYGNLPGLSMCQGNKIQWHMIGLGNEVDMHSVHFHGQILTVLKHHTDTVSLFPASSFTAEMVADNPGHWLLACNVNDHLMAGMQALFEIKKCFPNVHKPRPYGELRQYFIAAEEEVWDYAPTVPNDGEAQEFVTKGQNRIGSRYKKVRYVEYTDNSFMTKMLRSPEEQHLGILGPVLRAEEKDTIRVVFKNKASRPYTIQPHGVQYSIEQDGTLYYNELEESYTEKKLRELKKQPRVVTPPPAASVRPGIVYTYEWTVPQGAGPVEGEADCLTYLYYSAVDPVKDTSSGLVGPLLICRPGSLKKGIQKHYNKEFHLMATVFDENLSWYLDENIQTFTTSPKTVKKEDDGFMESNKMHAINGYVYNNLPGLRMCKGDTVSWHLSALGSETDIISFYFQGNRFIYRQNRRDSISVFPHISHTVTMEPDSMGQFEVVSATLDHYRNGMRANYTVEKCGLFQRQGEVMLHSKTYYIAAVEIDWDYSPNRTWEAEIEASIFLKRGPQRIGAVYKKAVYKQYTDATYGQEIPKPIWLGYMGPMLMAESGDKVVIHLKNLASRPYTVHPHGLTYTKGKEGETWTQHVNVRTASFVRPGAVYAYEWTVPNGAGPEEGEPDCLTYLYYSAVDQVKDTSSGLVGPLLICRPGSLEEGMQKNYNKEFHLMATVFDENLSWYLDENIQTFTTSPQTVDKQDTGFIMSNKMHAINGYVYNNLPGLRMCKGDKVSWHLSALGTETDIISFYFQGNRFIYRQNRRDSISVFPHISHTVTMEPDSMGQFEVASATLDHYRYGMRANYIVDRSNLYQRRNWITHTRTYFIAAVEIEWDYSPSRAFEAELYNGEIHTYTWYITKNTGPTPEQEPCIASAYFSTVDVTKDLNSGLIGPLVICRGWNKIFRLKGNVKEFATLFFIFDENDSWYLDDNIKEYISNPQPDLKSDENFIESNKMHGINGYVYGNLHLYMEVGNRVYWHILGMGNEVDIHTVHWHGHSLEYKLGGNLYRTDVYELFPATFQTTKLIPLFPGSWLFHCHVHDHIKAGMEAVYTVLEKPRIH